MFNLLWDLHQQNRINRLDETATESKNIARGVAPRIEEVERRNEALQLTCQALWELLRDKLQLTDQQLMAKVLEIDVRDGERDGKISARTVPCPQCQRPNKDNRKMCIYCGTEMPPKASII